MSTISVSSSVSSAYVQSGDLTGNLNIATSGGVINAASNTGTLAIPSGTTAQRPAGVNGIIRYNTSINALEGYANNTWVAFL